jgi:hypothetical protein
MVSYLSSFRLVFSVINIFRNRLHGKDFRFRMPVSPGALAVIGHSGYVQMIKKINEKMLLYAGYLPVHQYVPFIVVSTSYG